MRQVGSGAGLDEGRPVLGKAEFHAAAQTDAGAQAVVALRPVALQRIPVLLETEAEIAEQPQLRLGPLVLRGCGLSGGELGTTYFLPRMVGIARASEILMTGRTVGAEEADRIGMLTRLVPAEALMETAKETARQMLEKSERGLRLSKETIRQNLDAPSLENAFELENRNQSMLCTAPEFFEAIARFNKPRA